MESVGQGERGACRTRNVSVGRIRRKSRGECRIMSKGRMFKGQGTETVKDEDGVESVGQGERTRNVRSVGWKRRVECRTYRTGNRDSKGRGRGGECRTGREGSL